MHSWNWYVIYSDIAASIPTHTHTFIGWVLYDEDVFLSSLHFFKHYVVASLGSWSQHQNLFCVTIQADCHWNFSLTNFTINFLNTRTVFSITHHYFHLHPVFQAFEMWILTRSSAFAYADQPVCWGVNIETYTTSLLFRLLLLFFWLFLFNFYRRIRNLIFYYLLIRVAALIFLPLLQTFCA